MALRELVIRASVQRRLLAGASVLVPLAVLMSGPVAFGMAMTPGNDQDIVGASNPLLKVLIAVVATAVLALVTSWILAVRSAANPRLRGRAIVSAAVAIMASGLILLTAAAARADGGSR